MKFLSKGNADHQGQHAAGGRRGSWITTLREDHGHQRAEESPECLREGWNQRLWISQKRQQQHQSDNQERSASL